MITLEVEPMVTTVTLNCVRRFPVLLSLHFVHRFAFFALGISLRILAMQKIVFDDVKLTHTSPAKYCPVVSSRIL